MYGTVLAMHAFGLEKADDHERAAQATLAALRINPLDGEGLTDAAAVVRAAPDGLVVPKVNGPDELLRLLLGVFAQTQLARSATQTLRNHSGGVK